MKTFMSELEGDANVARSNNVDWMMSQPMKGGNLRFPGMKK